jgi:preprotein translocase subunit SecG
MGGILIAMAIFLVVAVLMQSGKDKRLSGSIAGGADTYYGQNKGRSRDKLLARLTTVIAILFTICVVVMYVLISRFYVA